MRKITTAIFLLIACIHNSWSDTNDLYTDCKYDDAETACLEHTGCYIESGTCTPCASGTYRDSTDNTATTCTSCEATSNIQKIDRSISKNTTLGTTTDDDNTYTYIKTGATSPNGCAVKIQCPAGTGIYYNTDDGDSISCKTCPYITNPSADPTSYVLNGDYFSNKSTSVEITDWRKLTTGVIFNYVGCHACPDNSTVNTENHTSCTCNAGYHNKYSQKEEYTAINEDRAIKEPDHTCTPNTYPVTVYNDCDVADPTVACNGTVAYKNSLSAALSPSSCSPKKTGYHRKDNNLNLYKKQGTNDEISTTYEINDEEPDTTYKLCPIWTANTFYIKYKPGTPAENVNIENMPSQNTECTYSETCEISSTIPTADKGYVFMGWQITSDNHTDSFNKNTKYQPKHNFTNATTEHNVTITLTAQWQQCPEGYYACENNSGKIIGCKCPAGSTSNPGAMNITACFITSATQFCTGDNCFTLNISNNANRTTGSDCTDTDKVKVPDTTN